MRRLSIRKPLVAILAFAVLPLLLTACETEPEVGDQVDAGADDATVTDVRYFSDWDGDDDGYLTVNEFATGMDTATWWDDWDVDNDTYLTEDEFGTAFGDYGWYNEGLFTDWDVDQDERLTEDEWQTGLYGEWDANEDERLAEQEFNPGVFGSPTSGVIRDLGSMSTASVDSTYFGRRVQLSNLYVPRVLSDRAFIVCSTGMATEGRQGMTQNDQQGAAEGDQQGMTQDGQQGATGQDPCVSENVLVLLDENPGAGPTPPPGTAVEGLVNVNEGQRVTISNGQIARFVTDQQAQEWEIADGQMTGLDNQEFLIRADSVNVTAQGLAMGR